MTSSLQQPLSPHHDETQPALAVTSHANGPVGDSIMLQVRRDEHETNQEPSPDPNRSLIGLSWLEKLMRWNVYTRMDLLVESSWPSLGTKGFLMFKAFAWAWATAIWIMSLSLWGSPQGKFFVFLTCWNLTSHLFYFNVSFYICLRNYLAKLPESSVKESHPLTITSAINTYTPHPRLLRFTYGLMQHTFAWTWLVVVVYWSTEFPSKAGNPRTDYDNWDNACIHALTLGFIVTDLILNRIEFVLTHVWYTMAISIIYLIVNGVYCAIAGGYIYNVLKWDHGAMTAGAIIGCALFLIGMYPVGHGIASKRNQLSGNKAPEVQQWCGCKPTP